jgi:hypothetical protein
MKIRAGYEIAYDCLQPTPMILTLSVHPSRFPDLLTLDRLRLDRPADALRAQAVCRRRARPGTFQ